jgi:Ca2+-binding EF-hand superfamily protein
MRSMGFELSKSEVKALMAIIDTDGNGTVELDEYIELMKDRLVYFFLRLF